MSDLERCDYWSDSITNGVAKRNFCQMPKGHEGYHQFDPFTGGRIYTEQEHQAEIAATVRKAAETCRKILVRQWREDAAGNPVLMEENGNIADLDIGPVEAILSPLTPPMTSALAEHDEALKREWFTKGLRDGAKQMKELKEGELAEFEAKVRAGQDGKWIAALGYEMSVGFTPTETDEDIQVCVDVSPKIEAAEAALAEARNLMPCGHPKVCLVDIDDNGYPTGQICTICAKITALQGALRWACDELEKFALQNVDKESKKLWKRSGKLAAATALLEDK